MQRTRPPSRPKRVKRISRRAFLRTALASSAALAAPTVLPGAARAAENGEPLATLLDLSRCVGCNACVDACHEANAHKFPQPRKPFPAMLPAARAKPEDWSDKRSVDDRLTPYNWLYIQRAEVEHNGETLEVNIPRRCMHCVNAPCAALCPFGACATDARGVTRINAGLCMGGAKCRNMCPWHVPQRQSGVGLYLKLMPRIAGNGVMYKCDRCADRLAQGGTPACIEACPEEVQTIGPRDAIVARAKALAAETDGYLYGLGENGGTNTVYLSPLPFEVLNEAVGKGTGKPHLGPAVEVMAEEEKLGWAALIAPVAGAVAGLTRLGRLLKAEGDGDA